VTFLVDAQLPPRLAWELSQTGTDVRAVRDMDLREAKDSEIWDYALVNESAIITKDQDFADRVLRGSASPVIIWLRIGNTSNRALCNWLLPIWPEILRRVDEGVLLIEVR